MVDIAARAQGLQHAVDSICKRLGRPTGGGRGLDASTRGLLHVRRLCKHPKTDDGILQPFAPTSEELEEARALR
jgi:citrate lyase beta subunit